ncbi:MAG: 50S ribosomal protein L23 [Planctomycetota bacterium]|jgi:large subunit ribosomal protein L23|nr:50S ribosomal protein L23 [Planctomycetota bacterium]
MPANVASTDIIKKPLLSEKSTYAMNEQKRYSFIVDRRATKTEIKKAVEEIYKVRVIGINTIVRKTEERRTKFGLVRPADTKKAIVRLHAEDTIELF